MRGAVAEHKSTNTVANGRSAGLNVYAPWSIPICLFVIYRDIHYAVLRCSEERKYKFRDKDLEVRPRLITTGDQNSNKQIDWKNTQL